jgi:hypothetical protein
LTKTAKHVLNGTSLDDEYPDFTGKGENTFPIFLTFPTFLMYYV